MRDGRMPASAGGRHRCDRGLWRDPGHWPRSLARGHLDQLAVDDLFRGEPVFLVVPVGAAALFV
jgi:hypothetical protein